MKYGSLFTGIGGFDLALDRCGMECAWQVEINKWRRKVLEKHWPDVERFEDVREVGRHNLKPVDLICGGFPCQDLSVAGKRGGLKAERSGLFFEFARIVGELQPAWFIVENVFGLLSSEAGRDFTIVLSTLDDLGYGLAWRVLDSRYFGVAQRRRRVYVVGYLGAPCPFEVLFEPEGGAGDIEAGGEAGEGVAFAVRTSASRCMWDGADNLAVTLSTTHGGGRRRCDDSNLVAGTIDARHGPGRYSEQWSDPGKNFMVCTPIDPHGVRETPGVPRRVDLQVREERGEEYLTPWDCQSKRIHKGIAPTIGGDDKGGQRMPHVMEENTRDESSAHDPCTCPDTPRYQALGDAVTVNVVEWIGRRIAEVSA